MLGGGGESTAGVVKHAICKQACKCCPSCPHPILGGRKRRGCAHRHRAKAHPSCCALWGVPSSQSCITSPHWDGFSGVEKGQKANQGGMLNSHPHRAHGCLSTCMLHTYKNIYIHTHIHLQGGVAQVINIPTLKISLHLLCPTAGTKYNHSICSLPSPER